MASNPDFVQFIIDQCSGAGEIAVKKMMGDYCVYRDGVLFGLICDNNLYIKVTEAGMALVKEVVTRPPYPGAREYLYIGDVEDRDYLEILIKATLPEVESSKARTKRKAPRDRQVPTSLDDVISPNVVCSQDLRAFFQRYLGPGFRFKVEFQAWLRGNAGKTYRDAAEAYPLLERPAEISPQFEYNQFIRDFFASNKGATFDDAVNGWKRKTIEREDPKDYENDNKNRGDRGSVNN